MAPLGRAGLIRIAFYSVLVPTFCVQLWLAADKLRDGRPGTVISRVSNSTQTLPAMLICNNEELMPVKKDTTMSSLHETSEAVEVLKWARFNIQPNHYNWQDLRNATVLEEVFGKAFDDAWQTKLVWTDTRSGFFKCYSLASFLEILPSMSEQLEIGVDKKTYLNFHEQDQMTHGFTRLLGTDPYVGGTTMLEHTVETVEISKKVVSSLSKPEKPCSVPNDEKVQLCLRNYMLGKVGCVPPWEKPVSNVRVCSTKDDLHRYLKVVSTYENSHAQLETIVGVTGCRINCRSAHYSAKNLFNLKQSSVVKPVPVKYILGFVMPEQSTVVEAEVVTYDWNNFVADAGGFLGLLLGISAMDVANVLERLARCLTARRRDKTTSTGTKSVEV